MSTLGNTLKTARENKGLSIQQIAEATHLMSSAVAKLENEDFSFITAPIYGRGFLKLYCDAVGLEPQPVIQEFMAIYNHENKAECSTPPEPAPVITPEPPPITASEPPERSTPPERPLSRYSTPLDDRERHPSLLAMNPALWRWSIIAIISLLIGWAGYVGLKTLYRMTAEPPSEEVSAESSAAASTETTATTPEKERTPIKVDAMYID